MRRRQEKVSGHFTPGLSALRTGQRHCPGGHLNNDGDTRYQRGPCYFLSLLIAVWLSHHHHRVGAAVLCNKVPTFFASSP